MTEPFDPLRQAFTGLSHQIVGFLPTLLAALLLLAFGWLVSRLLAAATRRVARQIKLDSAMDDAGWQEDLERAGIRLAPSEILARMVYWIVLLVFLTLAIENLGFGLTAVPMRAFIEYLPHVLGAVLILFAGAIFAGLISKAFSATLVRLDFAQHRALASFVQGLILLVTFLAAFDHLGFDVSLLSGTLANLLVIFAAAMAITFAFGGRDIARNMLAGYYARERFTAGEMLELSEGSGELLGIGTLTTVIETQEGRLVIPNKRLIEGLVLKVGSE